ncbi:synaptotagmin-16-like [Varroa jacobsoni]|uniref:synaptotagmin-16-like n=1 Tax=Varroa jacobsoni TaxID=62625 RepID=UPI000BF901A7|nr:synaptotagmin-16-like [Varroa jacobsoni]
MAGRVGLTKRRRLQSDHRDAALSLGAMAASPGPQPLAGAARTTQDSHYLQNQFHHQKEQQQQQYLNEQQRQTLLLAAVSQQAVPFAAAAPAVAALGRQLKSDFQRAAIRQNEVQARTVKSVRSEHAETAHLLVSSSSSDSSGRSSRSGSISSNLQNSVSAVLYSSDTTLTTSSSLPVLSPLSPLLPLSGHAALSRPIAAPGALQHKQTTTAALIAPSAAVAAASAAAISGPTSAPTSAPALALWLPLPHALGATLAGCAMLLASLVVLYYLYLNRRLCFHGLLTAGPDKRKYSDYSSNTLDDTFYYEDISASSDSDEHLINNDNLNINVEQQQFRSAGPDRIQDRPNLNERSGSVTSVNESNPFAAELFGAHQRMANLSYQSLQSCYQQPLTNCTSAISTTAVSNEIVDNQKITVVTTNQSFNIADASGGVLEVSISHDTLARRLVVSIIQVQRIPLKASPKVLATKTTAKTGTYRLKVTALTARQAGRLKQSRASKARQADQQGNCTFNEDLVFSRISSESISGMQLRFRIHSAHERLTRRQRLISEAIISLGCARLRQPIQVALGSKLSQSASGGGTTSSESEISDCSLKSQDSSTGSLNSLRSPHSPQHVGLASSPELLIGLAYNGTTGRLSVEVIGGSHLGVLPGVPHVKSCSSPDTFVKVCLVSSSGQEIASSKTSVRKGQADPVYKETFVFQVALFQLSDVTLILSAYKRSSMKRKQLVGWLSFGMNPSSDAQLVHWSDMREGRGEQVARWNTLIQSQG